MKRLLDVVRKEMDQARETFRFHYQHDKPSSLEYKRAYHELLELEREFNAI